MKKQKIITSLFILAALYDAILGMTFLIATGPLFKLVNIPPPNHFGYVHFPAALLIVFSLMFISIALHPIENRNLIPYGILLKTSYCGVVVFHWATGGIPAIWKPFCIVDFLFLLLFTWAWITLKKDKVDIA